MTPTLSQAIAAEHARQEAEAGEPVSRGDVVRGLILGGIMREQERRLRERDEQIARLAPPAEHPAGFRGYMVRPKNGRGASEEVDLFGVLTGLWCGREPSTDFERACAVFLDGLHAGMAAASSLASMRAELDRATGAATKTRAANASLGRRLAGAVALLREIEWSGRSAGERACPSCDEIEGTHAPGCKLAALIKERT